MGFFDSTMNVLGHGEGGFWSGERGMGVGQGLTNLGMGLLSQRPGEHWTAAFGRGMGGFSQGMQMGRDRFRRGELQDVQDTRFQMEQDRFGMEEERFAMAQTAEERAVMSFEREAAERERKLGADARLRGIWQERMLDPNVSADDYNNYQMLLELPSQQAAQIYSQQEMQQASLDARGTSSAAARAKFDYEFGQRQAAITSRDEVRFTRKQGTVAAQNKLRYQEEIQKLWDTDPAAAFDMMQKQSALDAYIDASIRASLKDQEATAANENDPLLNPGPMPPGVSLP